MCLFCSGCQHHTLIPTKDATAPLQQNKKHKDLCPHLAQDKMVFTGLQTIQILAMQGDIHIHIHMLACESCTARVPVSAAFPRMRHADLHSSLDGSDALPCLLHGCAWLLHYTPEQRLHFQANSRPVPKFCQQPSCTKRSCEI